MLHLFSGLDGGVKFLVDLRGDALRVGAHDPQLAALDQQLKAHLATLFDVGMLALRRITWDAPAALLEKLIAYEAVHTIHSWDDLKNRLDSDRRCYGFFHPAMPDEPLVFVEIALTAGIATELAPLLDAHAPELDLDQVDTAVFYSISNCQPGLTGVNLGTALIKQVVEALRVDLPQLRRFVTLSPIPGFRPWCEAELGAAEAGAPLPEHALMPAEPARVLDAAHRAGMGRRRGDPARAARARGALPHHDGRRARARHRRQLPPLERRRGRARELAGRPDAHGPGPVVRCHGQLPLRAGPHRGAGRGVRGERRGHGLGRRARAARDLGGKRVSGRGHRL